MGYLFVTETKEKGPKKLRKKWIFSAKTIMADGAENVLVRSDGSETEPEATANNNENSVNEQVLKIWKLQQESNTQLQKQMMDILSTMANAQVAQGLVQASASAQVATTHVTDVINTATAQIQLSSFDPDDTPYNMVEWMDDVTRIQQELKISDTVIVLKAGAALRGRAARFYKHWKPIVRNWASFRRDFEVAFPEQGTPATRVRACLAIVSSSFNSLVEYGNAKLSSIRRFYPDFPWNIVLSLIEYDIQNVEAKNRIYLQAPVSEEDLLKVLAVCDARKISDGVREGDLSRKRKHNFHDKRPGFQGNCRKCHRYGHKEVDCKQALKKSLVTSDGAVPGPSGIKPTYQSAPGKKIPICTYCKKVGHTEEVCFRKIGL